MHWFKYIVIGLTGLLVVSITMILILAVLLDQGQLRDALVYAVNRTTDHQLEINGPLQADFSLSPTLKVSEIRFKTASDNFELNAAAIQLNIEILPLLSKRLIVHELLLRDSTVSIRQQPGEDEGDFSWLAEIPAPTVENVNVENLAINYWQLDAAEPLQVNIDSLTLEHKADEPVSLKGAGAIDGTAFHLDGEFGTIASLIASDQPYPVKFRFDVMQAIIHAEGTVANPHEAGDLDVAVQVEVLDVQGALGLLHEKVPDIGKLMATGNLAGTLHAPELNDLDLSLTKDKVDLQVSGTVGNLLAAENIKLDITAETSDQMLLAWALPDWSPRFDSLQSSVTLSGSAGSLLLSHVEFEASDSKGHRLRVKGATRIVDATQPLRDLDAMLSISSPDTLFLKPYFDTIPVTGPLTTEAHVTLITDVLVVEDIKLALGNRQSVQLKAQGNIRNITFTPTVDVSEIDLNVDLAGTSARAIGGLIKTEWPDIGPVAANARYSGSIASSTLNNLHLQVGSKQQLLVDVRGDVRLAALDGDRPLAGLDLKINFEAPDAASFSAITGSVIPALGRVTGEAHISDASGVPAITALDINVQKGNELQFDLKGALADLEQMNGLNMRFDLVAKDMNTIGQLFDQPLPEEGKVKLSGRIKGGLEKSRFTGRVNLRNTTIETNLTAEFKGERPRLTGSISTPDLDVHDFGHYPEKRIEKISAPVNENDEWYSGEVKKPARTEPLFSREPIDLSALMAIDLDVEIKINKLSSAVASLESVYGHVILDKGKLTIRPVTLVVDGDAINIEGMIDSSKRLPAITLLTTGDNINLALLLEDPATKKSVIRGVMTARADLQSRGRSTAELAANLGGNIYMVTENAKVRKRVMNLVNVDVIGFVISNALSRKKDVNIGCAIFSMHFNEGMGETELFIIDTPETLVRIDADLNLVNETMDIAILPESKSKIRLFRKNKPMKIYGPITNPEYEVVSLADLTREATRSYLLFPLTITTSLLHNITDLIVKPDEEEGSCDHFLQ